MAGHDTNYIAISGALSLLGPQGRQAAAPVNLLGDFAGGGMLCALGICWRCSSAALGTRPGRRRGDGRRRGLSRTFVYKFRNAGMWRDERGTNMLDGGAPFYDTYRTKDGEFSRVGAIEPQFYAALLQGLGIDAATMPHQMDQSKWRGDRRALRRDLRDQDARRDGARSSTAPTPASRRSSASASATIPTTSRAGC
jgi:alpha-methylacyl-CoA racemase